MIVSVKPPYTITPRILKLIFSISEKIGEINANLISKPSPHLRKQNKIKTIPTAVSVYTKDPELAEAFNTYIAGEEAEKTWEKWGFEPCNS